MPKLTERQVEVRNLSKQGLTPGEIAGRLGITENGVYQHLRRIKERGGRTLTQAAKPATTRTTSARKPAARKSAAKATTKRRTRTSAAGRSGRTPSRSRSRAKAALPTGVTAPQAAAPQAAAPTTPLDAIRARRESLNAELAVTEAALKETQKAHEAATQAHETAVKRHGEELHALDVAEKALTGKLPKTVDRSRQRKSGGNGSTPVEPQAQPAPPAPAEAAAPQPQIAATPLAAVPAEPVAAVAESNQAGFSQPDGFAGE